MRELFVSTAYLPPIAFYASILKTDVYIMEKYETYVKQTYRNRCHIMSANGLLPLSIPIEKPDGSRSRMKDIQISNSVNWQANHWKAIESAYNKSPFFLYYRDEFEKFYTQKYENLFDFNLELIEFINTKIGLDKKIAFTEEYHHIPKKSKDARNRFHPKKDKSNFEFPHYYQVFEEKHGFVPNLSIIDLLFNEGPGSAFYLQSVK